MNVNFFQWIREGVKQSVLMGVSDAVGHLGPRPDSDPIGERLAGFLQPSSGPAPRQLSGSAGGRKKLGRSLKDIHPDSAKPAT